VPAEVDLRDFAFMPLDVRRLLTSETWMLGNGDERAAAMCLWLESWHQVPAGSLPDNPRILAHLSQTPRWEKVKAHAMRGWVKCADQRVYHPVVAEKALEAWLHKLARKARTEAARTARMQQRQQHSQSQTPSTENVTDNVTGSKGQGQGQGQGQGHKEPRSRSSTAGAVAGRLSDPTKDEIWRTGKALLEGEGKGREAAGSLLGKLCKDFGQVLVLQAIRDCEITAPVKPSEWLMARCQERRANGGNRQESLEERNRRATEGWRPPELREGNAT
jgi:hypothetical protein